MDISNITEIEVPDVTEIARIPLIFVSGPLTAAPGGKTSFDNMCAALKAGDALLAMGYSPLVPHTSLMWTFMTLEAHQRSYATWMRWCFSQILRCDALLRLPGPSYGADKEVAFAKSIGLTVYNSLDEVPNLSR